VKLAEEDDAAEVIGVVRGETLELLAYGHDANWLAGSGWAADGSIQVGFIGGDCGCLLSAGDEAFAELVPAFVFRVCGREASGRSCGEWSFEASDPVEGDLLPEYDVPELLIDRVRCARDGAMNEAGIEAFHDVGWVGCVTISDEGLG
jgi:hypothetical protein